MARDEDRLNEFPVNDTTSTTTAADGNFRVVPEDKLKALEEILRSLGSCVVAYSGGVDSVFLACMAHKVLGSKALAVIADSPSLPRRELAEALNIASDFAFPVEVVRTQEFENPAYSSNPSNRCYFCKHELFSRLTPLATTRGFSSIIYGENASDASDLRPGAKAAAEFEIRAPLKEAGLTKGEIRQASAAMGLPTSDKPQMACLSSRVPHGQAVTEAKLAMIENAENYLRDAGFYDVRVRHHDLSSPAGLVAMARVEVGVGEMQKFTTPGLMQDVAEQLRAFGYRYVTLDLAGYQRSEQVAPIHVGTALR